MALDTAPNFNPNTPIPNSPFYWPETNTIQGGAGVLVVGAGLTVNALGQLTATGGGGGGTGTVTQVNTGIGLQGGPFTTTGTISLIPPTGTAIGGVKAGSGIAIAVDGTVSSTRVSQVNTGTGLSGGPITSSGTISLNIATVTAIGGVKPDNTTIIIQPDGTISVGPGIADSVNSVTGSGAITVVNTDPQNPVVGVRGATTSQTGVVALSNAIDGTSQTVAASELAVSNLGAAALLKTGGTMTGNIAFAPTQTFPVASSTTLGVVKPDNTTITINGSGQLTAVGGGGGGTGTVTAVNTGTGLTGGPITVNGTISLLASTLSVIGGVRPDGTTITVDANGIISAISSGAVPAGSDTQVQFNNNGAFGADPGLTYNDGALVLNQIQGFDTTGVPGVGDVTILGGTTTSANPAGKVVISGGQGNPLDAFNQLGGDVSISGGSGQGTGNSGSVSIGSATPAGTGVVGGVTVNNIVRARTQSPYAVADNADLTTKSYVDGAIAALNPVVPGGTLFRSSPATVIPSPSFWVINTWSTDVQPNTLNTLTYTSDGRFTNTSSVERTYTFSVQSAFTSTSAISDAYLYLQKNTTSFVPTQVYGVTELGRGSNVTQGVLSTTWTFDLDPGEYIAVSAQVITGGTVTFSSSTIGGLGSGGASTIIINEIPGPGGAENINKTTNTFLPAVTYTSGTNNMINWPAAAGIDTLAYSGGVFTNNTNAIRVYTIDFQTYANSNSGALSESDVWVIVNTGSNPVGGGGFQRLGQQAFVAASGASVTSTFLSSSATVTLKPGGTFGVAYYAATATPGGTYVLGGASGASFPSGQSTRLTIKEMTNTPAAYQAGVLQNTEDTTAYVANTNTLLTFQTEVLYTNDSLIPDTVNGVRVWRNASTYARTYIFDYTANIATSSNVGLATIWLQQNSTSASATGRFAMTTVGNLNAPAAVISNTAAITLDPGEYVTAWFFCDQSGTISAGNFGFAAGGGTRITITEVTAVAEGFNQFPYQYGVFYSSNNTSQVVPAVTFTQIPVNNVVYRNSINANLIPLTNNLDGSWTCTQSGLFTFASEVQIGALSAASVVTMYIQAGPSKINSSLYVPAGYAPYSLNVTGTSFVQAGDNITLVLFREGSTTVQNASLSITTQIQG